MRRGCGALKVCVCLRLVGGCWVGCSIVEFSILSIGRKEGRIRKKCRREIGLFLHPSFVVLFPFNRKENPLPLPLYAHLKMSSKTTEPLNSPIAFIRINPISFNFGADCTKCSKSF